MYTKGVWHQIMAKITTVKENLQIKTLAGTLAVKRDILIQAWTLGYFDQDVWSKWDTFKSHAQYSLLYAISQWWPGSPGFKQYRHENPCHELLGCLPYELDSGTKWDFNFEHRWYEQKRSGGILCHGSKCILWANSIFSLLIGFQAQKGFIFSVPAQESWQNVTAHERNERGV